jgi:hypothetical protein
MQINILPFAEAIRNYADNRIILYNRVSSWGQAGPDKVKLEAKTKPVIQAVMKAAPKRLYGLVLAVEEGQIGALRRHLQIAVHWALEQKCILVAPDLSRFIRAEAYNRRTNRNAFPTAEEFAQLRERTHGIPLATIESPYLSEDERHSKATRRTGKAGRRKKIDDDLAHRIFFDLRECLLSLSGRGYLWEGPIRIVAKRYGVSRSTIERVADTLSPYGITWRELAIQRARDKGLPEYVYKFSYETKASRELDEQLEELVAKSGRAAPSAAVRPANAEPGLAFQEWKRELPERKKRWDAKLRKDAETATRVSQRNRFPQGTGDGDDDDGGDDDGDFVPEG